jgi:phage recombination protein Bet
MTSEAPETPPETATNVIALPERESGGYLTLRPGQTEFDAHQKAALTAIGIDLVKDPGIVPHARAFLHLCQSQGLDPFKREAYLIGRGTGEYRKWTMQTGIDGYRKMAARTGRFIRVLDTLWTGPDDDDRSYRMDSEGVMRRVWYDQWPASRGYPGAAKVVVQHYDNAGNVVTTSAVADWGMYAPFSPKYEGYGKSRTKVRGPDGKDVMVLNDMWEKGYAHMLSKCAEALAYRKAFPSDMGGFVTHEEMHRADQIERDRLAQVQAANRRAAFEKATQAPAGAVSAASMPVPDDAVEPDAPAGAEPTGPMLVGDVAEAVVDGLTVEPESAQTTAPSDAPDVVAAPDVPSLSEDERYVMAREELDYQASVLGKPDGEALAARQVKARR